MLIVRKKGENEKDNAHKSMINNDEENKIQQVNEHGIVSSGVV